jgi:hypothetical protein
MVDFFLNHSKSKETVLLVFFPRILFVWLSLDHSKVQKVTRTRTDQNNDEPQEAKQGFGSLVFPTSAAAVFAHT